MDSASPQIVTDAGETSTLRCQDKQGLAPIDLLLAVITAVSLVLLLLFRAIVYHENVTYFIVIGHMFGDHLGLNALATGPIGYDGQFFYFLARFSGHLPAGAIDAPAFRYSRILYPVVVRVLSLGNVDAIPWVMLAVNVAAISTTVGMLSWLLRQLGGHQWTALVIGFYCGQPLALLRDLSDPLAVFFVALALVGLIQRRWLLMAAALGLGMLTRESTLLFVACFALPLGLARQWRTLMTYAVIALAPYITWVIVIYAYFGSWAWKENAQGNGLQPVPFAGLRGAPSPVLAIQMVLFAGIPALVAIVSGILLIFRRTWNNPVIIGVATSAIVYGLAFTMRQDNGWYDIWAPYRLLAPLVLLLPVLCAMLKPDVVWLRRWNLFHAGLIYTFIAAIAFG